MSNNLKSVDVVQLTAAFQTIYTVPASTLFTVTMIHVVNTDSVDHTVRLVLDAGGGDTQAQALAWDFAVRANDFIEFGKGDVWKAGRILRAEASTGSAGNVVNLKLSGIETK